jgi:hypothetical protein
MRTTVFAVLLCSVMLAIAAPALADSPTQDAYSGTGAGQVSQAQATSSAKTLPFTGIDLGALAVVGVVLFGTGFVLRLRSGPGTD